MTIKLTRSGDGSYETNDGRYVVQCPHRAYPGDTDRQWYILGMERDCLHSTMGPYDTLREARQHLGGILATERARTALAGLGVKVEPMEGMGRLVARDAAARRRAKRLLEKAGLVVYNFAHTQTVAHFRTP